MKRQEKLNEAWCKYRGKCSTEIIQALAFALRWCDAHPAWISVEDELPKEWERVLCHGYDKRSKLGHGLIFVTCRVNKNNYSNYSHDGNGFVVNFPAPLKRVTHWMPTPQPPSSSEIPNNHKEGGER